MALLAEVCVHFLSKQALANQGQLQLILVVSLCERILKMLIRKNKETRQNFMVKRKLCVTNIKI